MLAEKFIRMEEDLETAAREYAVLHGRNSEFTSVYVDWIFWWAVILLAIGVLDLFLTTLQVDGGCLLVIGFVGTFTAGTHRSTVQARIEEMHALDQKFGDMGFNVFGTENGILVLRR